MKVLVAIDGSEQAEHALNCKYLMASQVMSDDVMQKFDNV